MSYFKTYSIDDALRYEKPSYSRDLNFLISKSEDYPVNGSLDGKRPYSPINNNSIENTQYKLINYNDGNSSANKTTTYYFTPKIFLKDQRPKTRFISITEDVQSFIEEAFGRITGKKLPQNIIIRVCNNEELRQIHSQFGSWSDNIQGFAINGKKLKKIFVKNAHLDELMLTIGHEIGHVFTSSLPNSHDEEAKAFSFAIKWAEIIRENNIGNLKSCIKENIDFKPAKNGLHDIAFLFVKNLLKKKEAMQIHWDLVKKYISIWNFYN